jgi:hypothetical protein
VVPGPPNVNVFAVDGETKVGENFEGKGHGACTLRNVEKGKSNET